jgi:hypothetical protein
MSGLDEINRIIRNSKIIPEKQKQDYEKKIESNPIMDFFNNNIFKDKTNEQTNNKK